MMLIRDHPQGRRARGTRTSSERGYVLVVFILFAALLFVGLSTVIPKAIFEGRRDREEELIFRGTQYQRAIALFYRKFGRYPNRVEELEKTNGIRFLRKRYKDPMTKEGEWRLIHVGPGGVFIDALTTPMIRTGAGTTATPGSNPQQGPQGQGASGLGGIGTGLSPSPGSLSPTGLQGGVGQSIGQSGSGSGATPAIPTDPTQTPSANPGVNSLLQSRDVSSEQQSNAGQAGSSSSQQGSSSQPTPASQLASGSQPGSSSQVVGGAPIAGFASRSKEDSIKVWNTYTEYDKWEFTYDPRQDAVAAAAAARQGITPTGGQPGGGQPGAGQPLGGQPGIGQPFGGQPGGGQPGGGMMPGPSPFPGSPIGGGFPAPRQR